jgi:serine palmitoyltransferase
MDLQETQNTLVRLYHDANAQFHRMPGSAIILRYIKSSYQDDPVRSAIELFLFLFAVRYMLSPSYSTQKKVKLTEEVRQSLRTRKRERGTDARPGDR